MDKITVLATSFNDEKNIKKFLDNLAIQTMQPSNVVIVDGGSKDNTVSFLNNLKGFYGFNLIIYGDLGRLNIAEGYNAAIKNSPTDLILILGIGNSYNHDFIKDLYKAFYEKKADAVYTNIKGNDSTKFAEVFNKAFVGGLRGKDFGFASNRGVMTTKKFFDDIGYFYEKFIYAGEDTELFTRAITCGKKVLYCAEMDLIWDTPISFSEYLKKNKFNAIADMQMYPKGKIIIHIIKRFISAGILIASACVNLALFGFLFACLIAMICYKTKCFDFRVILLRIHFLYLPSYYYIKFWKYTKKEFHVCLEDIPR